MTGVPPKKTDFVKAQRIKWFGHVMRRSDSEYLRAAVEWKPTGQRPEKDSEEAMNRWNKTRLGESRDRYRIGKKKCRTLEEL